MPFSDATKSEAKARAHYRCVICQEPYFLDVHHITREVDGGANTIENAAPLCPNCHTWFGHDPAKRREVTAKRDWWWERCARIDEAQMTPPDGQRFDQLFQRHKASQTQEQERLFDEMKTFIADQLRHKADEVSSASTMKDLVASSTTAYQGGVYATGSVNIRLPDHCPQCGEALSSNGDCPHCT